MENFFKNFIVKNSKGIIVSVISSIILIVVVIIIITQSSLDENLAILEAGLSDIPIIKNDDLQELGRLYSELNDKFEREIDELVTGKANRNNKANQELKHYGVYGQDNANPFKNDDYVNGANIKYEKIDASIKDGASNFNDIIAVMAVLYDQKMDMADIEEMKELFTDLFWLSHTFTFDSTELYPCRHGCVAEPNYKCNDVYKDYNISRIKYLKYDPFTVRKHDEYENYDSDTDFRIVYPEGQCTVCGKTGSGCERNVNKVCYHGNSKIKFSDYYDKKEIKKIKKKVFGEQTEITYEGPIYAELGEVVKPEEDNEEDDILGPEPALPNGENNEEENSIDNNNATQGSKIDKNDSSCEYYLEVKYCSKREQLSKRIVKLLEDIESIEDKISKESEKEEPNDATLNKLEEEKREKEEEKSDLEQELNEHISNVCEASETKAKYWCDGFKLCLGHRTHYTCLGHKIVLCLGHTSLNLTIKVLYRDELLDEAFKVFR